MANTKKYISLDKLSLYDEKIKGVIAAGDAATLKSAKDYADGLATNYDAAGSAASALAEAKTYADGKDASIQAAQSAAEAAASAASVADGKAVAAQGEIDALETYVGTFTHDTAKSVVEYINAKTDGIATSGNLEILAGRVTAVEGDVATIKGDYLKSTDKAEIEGKITTVETAVNTEKSRAEGIEAGLRTDVDAIKADYLKASDKTDLQGKIDLKADKTALDAEVERATGVEASLQTQINTIMSNPDAEGAINSINEFTAWVSEHGTIADGMRTDINKNKDDIAAMDTAYKAADTALSGRLDVLEAIDHDAYVAADTVLKNELNGEIAKKADASVVEAMDTAYKAADTAITGRLDAIEAQLGDGDGSVSDMIADAKQEAIDAAAAAADTKDEAVLAAAKKYADDEDAKIEERVGALETASATHALASDLTALDGRVATVEGKVTTLEGKMTAVETLAAANKAAHEANAAAIATKASQDDLTAVSNRVTTIENWHANFVEVSEEEINALFA